VVAGWDRGRWLGLLAFCLVLAAACGAAGAWQLDRYGEKRQANADLRANVERPPMPVGEVLAVGRAADEAVRFRRVTASGEYDERGQVLVRQRQVAGRVGFLVVTPLRTRAGVLLVVRGFAPATGAATDTPRVPAPPAGTVEVTGRAFPSEAGRSRPGLPAGQVDRIDVRAIAERLGTPAYGGYAELISPVPADAGLAQTPAPDLSNPAGGAGEGQHLAYVVQWFFFALLALAGPVLLPGLDRRAARGESAGGIPATEPQPAA